MRRWVAILSALSAAGCTSRPVPAPFIARPVVQAGDVQASRLEGVWRVIEQSSRTPGEAWAVTPVPYRSLYLFTDTHYSYMFTRSAPRPPFAGDPNNPSDAEKVRAYDSFVAAAGTYEITGTTLTLVATLHKNPSEMTGEPLRYAVEIEQDTVRLTITNPPFQPGRERRTVLARLR